MREPESRTLQPINTRCRISEGQGLENTVSPVMLGWGGGVKTSGGCGDVTISSRGHRFPPPISAPRRLYTCVDHGRNTCTMHITNAVDIRALEPAETEVLCESEERFFLHTSFRQRTWGEIRRKGPRKNKEYTSRIQTFFPIVGFLIRPSYHRTTR